MPGAAERDRQCDLLDMRERWTPRSRLHGEGEERTAR